LGAVGNALALARDHVLLLGLGLGLFGCPSGSADKMIRQTRPRGRHSEPLGDLVRRREP